MGQNINANLSSTVVVLPLKLAGLPGACEPLKLDLREVAAVLGSLYSVRLSLESLFGVAPGSRISLLGVILESLGIPGVTGVITEEELPLAADGGRKVPPNPLVVEVAGVSGSSCIGVSLSNNGISLPLPTSRV